MQHRRPDRAVQQQRWLVIPEPARALAVRNRADEQFLAVEQQHERVLAYCARDSHARVNSLTTAA